MTSKEFFEALSQVPGKWFLTNGVIRAFIGDKRYCPITAVCKFKTNQDFNVSNWPMAAAAIGLNYILAKMISTTADDNVQLLLGLERDFATRNKLKKRLRAACNL